MKRIGIFLWTAALVLLLAGPAAAESKGPEKPSEKDKCPVCGMFVYKYPDWLAEIVFRDGTVDFFDGPKDMFSYYFNLKKYRPEKSRKDIAALYVREYYDMEMIDAQGASYVTGSDVYGPMGYELVPFATKGDAESFMTDHRGKTILRFPEVTTTVLGNLD